MKIYIKSILKLHYEAPIEIKVLTRLEVHWKNWNCTTSEGWCSLITAPWRKFKQWNAKILFWIINARPTSGYNGKLLEDYEIKYLLENHKYKKIQEPFHQNNPNYREFGKPENEPVWHWTITVVKVNGKYYEIEWKQVNKPNYDSIYPNPFPKQISAV